MDFDIKIETLLNMKCENSCQKERKTTKGKFIKLKKQNKIVLNASIKIYCTYHI